MGVIELGRLPNLRKLIIPDPGYTMVDMDLDRADIQIVAWDSGDENLKAKLKAERDDPTLDLHTSNAIELFGDGSSDKRKLAKIVAHAADYLVSPGTLSAQTGIPKARCAEFLAKWYSMYPGILSWHRRVEHQLQTTRMVTNKFGYRHVFFDRLDRALPEAVAWIPQSVVGLIINKAMLNIMRNLPEVNVLLQAHDSLTIQVRTEALGRLLPAIRRESMIPVPYSDPLTIPVGFSLSNKSWGEVLAARVNDGVVEVEINKQWVLFNPKEH